MKIHVWNAFASNNSGSYTVVGAFDDTEVAARVAAELSQAATAHAAWAEEGQQKGFGHAPRPSPLEALALRHGLGRPFDTDSGMGPYDSFTDLPQVWAMGHQVFVYHPFTLDLPHLFGEAMYAHGGRVETTLEHVHHPVVSLFRLSVPLAGRPGQDIPARAAALVEALHAEDGPLTQHVYAEPWVAWQVHAGHPYAGTDLTLGVAFDELVEGFRGVEALAREHGFTLNVSLSEAWSDGADPLGFLRPCVPPLKQPLYDVVLTEAGATPTKELTRTLAGLRRTSEYAVRTLHERLPATVVRRRPPGVAEAMAALLRREGAIVELRPSTT
ncbi:hypothetical protein D7Y13_30710 [Corallococcus praedator]|uniref:Uncharacterized protein n=1 Tax=Corallococcus praedator TaxID=2316724 RepID=A0ABX9QAG3_9BACT|nr:MULTISPECIES: hypothetical protein [Corallococcus]RKH31474.1 hypothetical protein D7X75_19495 [Corallococcus sp. CA031C]RKH96773.1 hypothetical protein D7Y13_30710 [Corallococcus praedator]